VELGGARGLEPLTPCLQSDVSARCGSADLARQLSVSSREVPLPTAGNDASGTVILLALLVRSRSRCLADHPVCRRPHLEIYDTQR
jgi:hypothetical protein